MQSARQDIRTVESWGYSTQEALAFVTRRAVAEARLATQQPLGAHDRDVLEAHLAYLAELRTICVAALGRGTVLDGVSRRPAGHRRPPTGAARS